MRKSFWEEEFEKNNPYSLKVSSLSAWANENLAFTAYV